MHTSTDNIKLAVAAILAAVFALSLGDALIKKFNASFTLWQIFILRSALAVPPLLIFIKRRLPPESFKLSREEFRWCALRSAMLVVMWLVYYAALPHLQLSPAAAMFYTTPLFIVLFSAVLIGGGVGMRGWIAVSIGFCGVLLILRPRAEDFNVYALLPLISAVLYALSMILTRTRCRNTHPLTLALGMHFAFITIGVGGAIITAAADALQFNFAAQSFLSGGWSQMNMREWIVIFFLAIAAIIGSIGTSYAYQLAPPPVVAPFDFAYLAFSVLWGVTIFADAPGIAGMTGIILIAAAGLLALRRRRQY